MVTRIVLIRHGPADAASRLCGNLDVPLTPAGAARVRSMLGRAARHAAADALFTSPLTRARDVATALGQRWRLPPRRADWAREIHCGSVEGMPLEQLARTFPELWARNAAQRDERFAWPGGETYAAFRARVLAGLARVAANYAGSRVAVITHTGVITQVLGVVHGRPASVWSIDRPDPLTATEVAWEAGRPTTVFSFNDPDWY